MTSRRSVVRALRTTAMLLVACLAAAPVAQADLVFDGSPGSGLPPATLGGYTMVNSPQDLRSDYSTVTDAPATPSTAFSFGSPMIVATLGSSWNSSYWGGGTYAGRLYNSFGASTVTITLPAPSTAVYFYAAPDQVGTYNMQAVATALSGATASSGQLPVPLYPSGDTLASGQYFGFYGTGADLIQSITLSLADNTAFYQDFEVGDFALAGAPVPAPISDDDLGLSVTPGNISADATSPLGATVTYTVPTAVDEDTPATASVACTPPPGSVFAIGLTSVTCTATDADDVNDPVSFTVTVNGATQQLSSLSAAVHGVGPGASLASKVAAVETALGAGQTGIACSTLAAFGNEVQAQTSKSIAAGVAAGLIADAEQIEAVIGCPGS
jgi:hypothetical protein